MVKASRLKFTYSKIKGGKAYWFFRRGDVHIVLGGNPVENEGASGRYWAARSRTLQSETKTHTIRNLIASYRQSSRWPKGERTRKDYLRILGYIGEKIGNVTQDARRVERRHVIAARDRNAHRPRHANYVVTLLALLFEHAIDLGWRKDNPAKGVGKLSGGTGYQPWPESAIASFRREARGPLLTCFELALGTGQCIADVLEMRWNDIQDGGIWVTQNKTGARLWIPFTPALAKHLEAVPRGLMTIVTNESGQPMTYSAVQQRMDHIRKKTGTSGFT